jgi:hypothetical protein
LMPMSPQNHLKLEAPQHATAARFASVRQNFFRLLSPSKTRRRVRSEPTPQGVASATLDAMRRSGITAPFSVQSYLCHRSRDGFRWDGRRRNHRTNAQPQTSHFDVSIFRRFHPKPPRTRIAPTHARRKSCKRKNSLVSPYVTFTFCTRHATHKGWRCGLASGTHTLHTRNGATDWRAGCPRYPGNSRADAHEIRERDSGATRQGSGTRMCVWSTNDCGGQPRRRRLWAGACMTLGMATRSGQVMMST